MLHPRIRVALKKSVTIYGIWGFGAGHYSFLEHGSGPDKLSEHTNHGMKSAAPDGQQGDVIHSTLFPLKFLDFL